jgi:hypothetical protein
VVTHRAGLSAGHDLRVKIAFKCVTIQNEVNVPRNRKAVNTLFLSIKKGGCTLHMAIVVCRSKPSTAKAVHGVIGGKGSPASYEAGEFSFYKQNEICMDTNYGKQIISTY